MTLYILVPSLVVFFLITVRRMWVLRHVEQYTLTAGWYCWRTKQPSYVAAEMSVLWPTAYLYWEFWRWDFRRYVVHQDHFDAMAAQVAEDLKRTDLDWDTFQRDKAAKPSDHEDSIHGDN